MIDNHNYFRGFNDDMASGMRQAVLLDRTNGQKVVLLLLLEK